MTVTSSPRDAPWLLGLSLPPGCRETGQLARRRAGRVAAVVAHRRGTAHRAQRQDRLVPGVRGRGVGGCLLTPTAGTTTGQDRVPGHAYLQPAAGLRPGRRSPGRAVGRGRPVPHRALHHQGLRVERRRPPPGGCSPHRGAGRDDDIRLWLRYPSPATRRKQLAELGKPLAGRQPPMGQRWPARSWRSCGSTATTCLPACCRCCGRPGEDEACRRGAGAGLRAAARRDHRTPGPGR